MADLELDHVSAVYPDGTLALDDISLHVADGEVVTVVGASGSGKTTLLRVVAGLEQIESGSVFIGGRDVTDVSAAMRDIAMVFEADSLYPHLTAEGNMRFGLRVRHTPDDEIDDRVGARSRMLGLRGWLHRRPATLSAGEKQRVAVGRATVRRPALYLFDEPLTHLDPGERFRLRRELATFIRSTDVTAVIVTHDQEQAMAVGDRVAVIERGRIHQVGEPSRLYAEPADTTVAAWLGDPPMALLPGWLEDDGVGASIVLGPHRFEVPGATTIALRLRLGEPIVVGVRPEHVAPVGTGRRGGAEIELAVTATEWRGGDQLLVCAIDGAGSIVSRAPAHLRVRPGDRVRLAIDTSRLSLFDPVSGAAIWHGASAASSAA
jgi:multiple sugar transport system ATP-binding protein